MEYKKLKSLITPKSSGIPRLKQVNQNIFRSGRPPVQDLEGLQKSKGIATIIDLENPALDKEKAEAERLGMKFISSPMNANVEPSKAQIDSLMKDLTNPENFPILVHCEFGRDRTGLIIGLYRVLVEKMDAGTAYKEMIDNGFRPFAPLVTAFKKYTS